MLALVLWWTFGWRIGLAEVLAELMLCALLTGGGGGRRIRRSMRYLTSRRKRRRLVPVWR